MAQRLCRGEMIWRTAERERRGRIQTGQRRFFERNHPKQVSGIGVVGVPDLVDGPTTNSLTMRRNFERRPAWMRSRSVVFVPVFLGTQRTAATGRCGFSGSFACSRKTPTCMAATGADEDRQIHQEDQQNVAGA